MKKHWYMSKTIWIAIVGVVAAVYDATGAQVPVWLYPLLVNLGLITARNAAN